MFGRSSIFTGRWIPTPASRVAACVAAVTLLGACVSLANDEAQKISDDDLLEAVETELRLEPLMGSDTMSVEVDEGIVKLTGDVRTLLAKRRAFDIVGNLKGVRAIVNALVVVSPGGTDDEILKNVRRALRDSAVTESYEIQPIVKNGHVLLEGEVDSYAEREMAEVVVTGVIGVVEIENQVKTKLKDERSDSEIEADVKGRLQLSPRVAGGMIAVNVEDGIVKLAGSVGSFNEKRSASLVAWVAGVKDVNVQELDVIWWLDRERRRDKFTVLRNDVQIREAVEDALMYDPRVKNSKIEVRVLNGAVSLVGKVSSLTAKRAADDDARNTLGVRDVINNLEVDLVEWPGDAIVSRRVEATLERDAILSRKPIEVSSHFGTVHLHGRVQHAFEKQRAESLVSNVRGVKGVNNQIMVASQWTKKADVHIQQDLQRRLRWSPNLRQEDLEIAVDQAVVTLTGKVDTWRQRSDVEAHAHQAGARKVVNELKLPYPVIQ